MTAEIVAMPVEVRRSKRRRKTINAYQRQGRLVVLIPDALSTAEEQQWVQRMRERFANPGQRRSRGVPRSDAALSARAQELSHRYLQGAATARSVRWVSNQHTRWGSCSTNTGDIRLSDQLTTMPSWVNDYVLMHELVHLVVPAHNAEFWELANRYPHTQRARGYLEGYVRGLTEQHKQMSPERPEYAKADGYNDSWADPSCAETEEPDRY